MQHVHCNSLFIAGKLYEIMEGVYFNVYVIFRIL